MTSSTSIEYGKCPKFQGTLIGKDFNLHVSEHHTNMFICPPVILMPWYWLQEKNWFKIYFQQNFTYKVHNKLYQHETNI